MKISKLTARDIWIHTQGLDRRIPFGTSSSKSVAAAISHLGYVQIDTINVIERCHHHILFNRLPGYRPEHLHLAQSRDKSIFEYWSHALAYIPTADYRFFMHRMQNHEKGPSSWFRSVTEDDFKKVKKLLKEGPVSIREIKDDVLVEKTHPWGSSKPSKRALQLGFYTGEFVISSRDGIIKRYDLASRHFAWKVKAKMAKESEYLHYILERSLRSQGFVSLDSVCYLEPSLKKSLQPIVEKKIKKGELVEVMIQDVDKQKFYIRPSVLDSIPSQSELTHILSPFDPLIIQRKRLHAIFDYEHLFEAYVPKEKRKYGYFTLPVLQGNRIVALLDLKTDRKNKEVLIQNWVWLVKKSAFLKSLIEKELGRFENFQLSNAI